MIGVNVDREKRAVMTAFCLMHQSIFSSTGDEKQFENQRFAVLQQSERKIIQSPFEVRKMKYVASFIRMLMALKFDR